MSDETRKQGSVLPLGESLAGFLCSDGVFRVKSGEFRQATVGEWWQDKANGRIYCVNSEYPQDILVEPSVAAGPGEGEITVNRAALTNIVGVLESEKERKGEVIPKTLRILRAALDGDKEGPA